MRLAERTDASMLTTRRRASSGNTLPRAVDRARPEHARFVGVLATWITHTLQRFDCGWSLLLNHGVAERRRCDLGNLNDDDDDDDDDDDT
jgi:hypothetical protein